MRERKGRKKGGLGGGLVRAGWEEDWGGRAGEGEGCSRRRPARSSRRQQAGLALAPRRHRRRSLGSRQHWRPLPCSLVIVSRVQSTAKVWKPWE